MKRTFKAIAVGFTSAALVALSLVVVPTTAQANTPVCATVGGIKSCQGKTSDGAVYTLQAPLNFNGTAFLYSKGYRPAISIPGRSDVAASSLAEQAPGPDAATKVAVATYLLSKGYGVFSSGFAKTGWNSDSGIKTNVELIGVWKKEFPNTKKIVAWGESGGGFMTQALAENHPTLIDAAVPLCMVGGSVEAALKMAGDALWGIKTFFDPTIKGGSYSAGTAGYAEAMGDLVEVFTAIGAMQALIAADPSTTKWPATSKVPDAIKAAIPSRSALVMVALMSGLPMQSAHFDSTSGPAALGANVTSFQIAINPAFAALENLTTAAALGVLATHDIEQQSGGAVFDNTATDYAARIAEEQFVWSSALSGVSGTAGLLSVLAASPRAKADPAAVAKMKTLASHSGKVEIPTILFTGVADPVTIAGNQQSVADKYAAYYAEKWAAAKKEGIRVRPQNNQLVLWNFPPEKYTKYNGITPDTSVPAATGTNHCNFTTSQLLAIADLLAYAADNGKNMAGGALLTKLRKAGNMTYDRGYSAPKMKYYGN